MKHKYTKEILEEVVARSESWAAVCRELGIAPATGSQTHLKRRAVALAVDFTHFTGQAWNRGKVHGYSYPLEEYLNNSRYTKSDSLRKRLIREGIREQKCEICGLSEWRGEELVLELDHINNDHFDNRLENLMIVCPNCHALKTRKAQFARRKSRVPVDQLAGVTTFRP